MVIIAIMMMVMLKLVDLSMMNMTMMTSDGDAVDEGGMTTVKTIVTAFQFPVAVRMTRVLTMMLAMLVAL